MANINNTSIQAQTIGPQAVQAQTIGLQTIFLSGKPGGGGGGESHNEHYLLSDGSHYLLSDGTYYTVKVTSTTIQLGEGGLNYSSGVLGHGGLVLSEPFTLHPGQRVVFDMKARSIKLYLCDAYVEGAAATVIKEVNGPGMIGQAPTLHFEYTNEGDYPQILALNVKPEITIYD